MIFASAIFRYIYIGFPVNNSLNDIQINFKYTKFKVSCLSQETKNYTKTDLNFFLSDWYIKIIIESALNLHPFPPLSFLLVLFLQFTYQSLVYIPNLSSWGEVIFIYCSILLKEKKSAVGKVTVGSKLLQLYIIIMKTH